MSDFEYDYVIIGSGFGGSVSALRLSEKSYNVVVIEKGSWKKKSDFPKTNWNLKKWLWFPIIGFKGIFKLTFFRHLSVISGVGVGGGSLVYANTLPIPKSNFFHSGSWQGLDEWEEKLMPFYKIAQKMLGVVKNPKLFDSDLGLKKLGEQNYGDGKFDATNVGVYFGGSEQWNADPFFGGEGPERKGCIYCGQCMTGCPHDAKNSLDKNYLYLAMKNGAKIMDNSFVVDVKPIEGGTGYEVLFRKSGSYFSKVKKIKTKGVVFAGGVLGTVPLLLSLKKNSMPEISDVLGKDVRSNNEALIFVTTTDKKYQMSEGIAIGSILETSPNSHLEAVRYGKGSGFWRVGLMPMITEKNFFIRFVKILFEFFSSFWKWLRIYFVRKFPERTVILLYMEDLEGKLQIIGNRILARTKLQDGNPPSAFIPRAHDLAKKYAGNIKGKASTFFLESLFAIPSTAHILGGCPIGENKETGVIDKDQKLFGYDDILVCDGSAMSSNPGVNPSLTITAMTEYTMSKIPRKSNIDNKI
ncbi:MAG: GMC oxidoreductase [Saprospiraceae bacterium]